MRAKLESATEAGRAPCVGVTGLDGSGKTTLVRRLAVAGGAHLFRLPHHKFVKSADRGCVKSTSFGYSLRVEYRGERSPDLACPVTDPRLAVLVADIGDIERAVGRMPPA